MHQQATAARLPRSIENATAKPGETVGKIPLEILYKPHKIHGIVGIYCLHLPKKIKCIHVGKYTIYMEISWASEIANFCEHGGNRKTIMFF